MGISLRLSLLLGGLFLVQGASADSYFFPTFTDLSALGPKAVPVSQGCTNAILGEVDCDQQLLDITLRDNYAPLADSNLQDSVCRASCGTSLTSYIATVTTACANDPEPSPGLPAPYFGEWALASYNIFCVKDSMTGQYCNEYIAALFSSTDPDQPGTDLPPAQLCSNCVIAFFQQIQSTSFSNYDERLASIWANIQTTCSLSYPTDVPELNTNVTSPAGFAPPGLDYNAPCASGNTYTVMAGDNCQVIAERENVATGTLIIINNLLRACTDLWVGAEICLPETCTTYQPITGDTCVGIASTNGISYEQLLAWNPALDSYCTNLIAGSNICISPPGAAVWTGTPIPSATVTRTAIYATATVVPPNNVADGTTTHCGKYYTVVTGDYCETVALAHGITLGLFLAINPSIDLTCSNLLAGVSYCVFPTADWDAPPPTPTIVPPPAGTPPGTTPDCYEWYVTQPGDYCWLIQTTFGISFEQLQFWNPHLNNDCTNLWAETAYCVEGAEQPPGGQGVLVTTGEGMAMKRAERTRAPEGAVETGGVAVGYPYPGGGPCRAS